MGDARGSETGLKLYTNHACPWAHRAHIAVRELGISYDETIIDLERPRDQWYLDINDRGLVPTIQHKGEDGETLTVIESALVVQFLLDTHPEKASKIFPPGTDAKSAYQRYQINLLVDTFFNKVVSLMWKTIFAHGSDEAEAKADELYEAIEKNIEPQLSKAIGDGPFIHGSQNLTLAEILMGSFVLRIYDFAHSDGKIFPVSLGEKIDSLPVFSRWAKAVASHDSVTYIWNKDEVIERTLRKLPEMRKKFGMAK